MRYRHIPPVDWREFAERFSAGHEGWIVSLYRDRGPNCRHCLAHEQPLHGLSIHGDEAAVTVGGPAGPQFEIPIARDLILEQTDNGADVALSFVEPAGHRLVVEFRSPVPLVAVDGIAREKERHEPHSIAVP